MEYLLLGLVVLAFLFAPFVVAIAAFVRTRRLSELAWRIERLEATVRELRREAPTPQVSPAPHVVEAAPQAVAEPILVPATPVAARPVAEPTSASRPARAPGASLAAIDWEWFIGRKALGWVAVVLIIFATAFFLRYAFENNWIGPIGRVALAAAGGMALVVAGWHYDQHRGWRLFAQMLSGAGVVLLYLATYSAFGFYHLLPQRSAAPFLVLIAAETMVLAALYDAPALAFVAVFGGLLTPVLLRSETDQYTALFLYLGVLDAAVVLLGLWRPWPVVTTTALVGTQLLFWLWYSANDHPEKLPAEVSFQASVFLLFVGHTLAVYNLPRSLMVQWEDLGRWVLNAFMGFIAFYILLRSDYRPWMGILAVAMAAFYAALALRMLRRSRQPADERLFLASLAIAVGFIAAAFPIQARAPWTALGWAAEAGVLWWFGIRVHQAPLRALAAALALLATARVLFFDTFGQDHAPALPVFNEHALPAIGASACLLVAAGATRRLQLRQPLDPTERVLAAAAVVGGILQLWLVMSVDLYTYCQNTLTSSGPAGDDRLAQMALSVFWAIYATVVLAVGFRFRSARLRWTALALYGITVAKVFVLDMAGLDQLYRILAVLVLALLLGLAAAVYQRIRPDREKAAPVEN
jgi:uncharacterized membrane protein